MRRALPALLASAAGAAAHGMLRWPPSRNSRGVAPVPYKDTAGPDCPGGACDWFSQGCSIGCGNCTGDASCVRGAALAGCVTCPSPRQPTLNAEQLRTFNMKAQPLSPTGAVGVGDWTAYNPWRAPGSAPVLDPCGIAGGGAKHGAAGNGGVAPPGSKQGDKGSRLPPLQKGEKVAWQSGGQADVAWAISANHGGGYQYRLCPAGSPLTEACFQSTPLDFVGGTQWIRWGDAGDPSNQTEIPAVRTSEGTAPPGSQWTRNPVPACAGAYGGALRLPFAPKCTTYQFDPPLPGIAGFGGGACLTDPTAKCFRAEQFQFAIVDRVQVPPLPAGEYVVGFRWDSEQTPQVWTSCGDVTIGQ